jgi:hypothetical protein
MGTSVSFLRPHVVRHEREHKEEKRDGERVDRWAPHVSDCGSLVGGSWVVV